MDQPSLLSFPERLTCQFVKYIVSTVLECERLENDLVFALEELPENNKMNAYRVVRVSLGTLAV